MLLHSTWSCNLQSASPHVLCICMYTFTNVVHPTYHAIGRVACCGCTLLQCTTWCVTWPARRTVVEGFYKHVGVDPCTLSVYHFKFIHCMYIIYNTPSVFTWRCSTSGSIHQILVCQRLHLVESEPLIVYMDVK